MFTTLQDKFYNNFIADERWKYIAEGLGVTLRVTFFAVIIGIVLGFLVAIVRSTYDKTGKLRILNAICKLYLTVIRGTPVVVQLLIIYFVIFGSSDVSKVLVAASDVYKRQYDAFMPLIAVALIYLAMVLIFTKLVNMLERRLRSSDH